MAANPLATVPAQLVDAPPIPPLAAHVWGYFIDITKTRPAGGFGPSRLSRLEIQAWEADEGVALERWERRAILMLDAVYMATLSPSPVSGHSPAQE